MRIPFLTLAILVLLIAGATGAVAQISIEIVNAPSQVPSFGPLYVLYSVKNVGRHPVYVPAEVAPMRGTAVYLAPAGDTLRPPRQPLSERLLPHAIYTMWLAPGERWLFYEDIGRDIELLEGELSIQAVLSSNGLCHDRQEFGRSSFPLEPLYIETGTLGLLEFRVYRCWEGEVRSGILNISIREPSTAEDQAAFQYLVERRSLVRPSGSGGEERARWRLFLSDVPERFPESHYAYVTLAGQSSVYAKKQAIELQPGNTLNPWVMGGIARQVLDAQSSCWKHRPLRFDLDSDELELPDGVREYLEQYEWYLENRHCPNQLAAEQRRRELEERRRQESSSDTDSDAGGGS
jgi:hypothetical protein